MATIGLKAVFTGTDRVSGPAGRVRASIAGITKTAGVGLSKLKAFGSQVAGAFKTAALAAGVAGVAVGAVAKNIIGSGANFEEAISAVGAVSLQTRDQIAPLEKEALRLGATTKFTATEAANAMEIMARSGFKNEEILSGVGGVLSAAAASGLEMAEVAGVVSNALKGMGLEANQASRVADVLALASSRTNSTIGSLGESMKNLAPVARQLNIPFEQATAAVALLQDVGLDASEAGTATATMLTKLANPSSAMAAEMRKLGIAFQDANGNALPLPRILKQFDTASKKTGGNMKVLAFFSELVGLRGQKAALNLKDLFASGKLSTLTDELDAAAGVAEKMAALRLDNLKGDWTLLTSAADGFKTSLFQTQSGPLRDLVKGVTKWIELNKEAIKTNIAESIKKAAPFVTAFFDSIGAGFREAWPQIKQALGMFDGLQDSKSTLQSFKDLGFVLGQVSALAIGVGVNLARLTGGALAGLTFALNLVKRGWNGLIEGIGRVAFAIDDAISNMAARWRAFNFLQLGAFITGQIGEGIASVRDFLGNIAFSTLKGALSFAWSAVKGAFNLQADFAQFGVDVIKGIVQGIKDNVGFAIDEIAKLGDAMVAKLKGVLRISSPSRITAEIGGFAAQGLGVGWREEMPGVNREISRTINLNPAAQTPAGVAPGAPAPAIPPAFSGDSDSGGERVIVIQVQAAEGAQASIVSAPEDPKLRLVLQPSGGFY